MAPLLTTRRTITEETAIEDKRVSAVPVSQVALLTGGFDRPYAFGLSMALTSKGVSLDVIGSDDIESPEMHLTPKLNFLNLHGDRRPDPSLTRRIRRVLSYYVRLIRYASTAKPKIFHILWNSKIQYFDRTLLMSYYKLLGKKIVFTAHNVNAGKRDSNDSGLNRFTLKVQYKLADHIFVHTDKMKAELLRDFGIQEKAVTVIPFGINNSVPDTNLNTADARRKLGILDGEKAILFYGAIRQYKGLEYLVGALQRLAGERSGYRLVIAGEPKRGAENYLREVQRTIREDANLGNAIQRIEFIPDEETELYFKAADVTVLPYTRIFQSGVLFLAYSFGLPVIASDVGSFRDDIIEGSTGFLCRPCDTEDLARSIETYFGSELFKNLTERRKGIREHARQRYSWEIVGEITRDVYASLLKA
jgi:D-inositol-3-phosphate glycosyltransferase